MHMFRIEGALRQVHLFSFICYSFPLPDFVIQIDDKVFGELSFRLSSEMKLSDLQNLFELLPCQPTYPPWELTTDIFISWE